MNPRSPHVRWLAGLAALAILLAVVFRPHREPEAPAPAPPPRELPPAPAPRPPTTIHPSMELAERFLVPDADPREDVEILETLIADFARALGGNPVGENEEIVAALQGANPKGLRFFPDRHRALGRDGKLHDRWGSPWVFHALSGKEMEIISAGPDREAGTADDLAGRGGG